MDEAVETADTSGTRVNISSATHQRALALAEDRVSKIKKRIISAVGDRDVAEQQLLEFEDELRELQADLVLYTQHLTALQGVEQ